CVQHRRRDRPAAGRRHRRDGAGRPAIAERGGGAPSRLCRLGRGDRGRRGLVLPTGLLSWRHVMKRGIVLGVLVAASALAVVKAQPPAPDPNAPKVVEVDKVKDNLYVLKGGGGNTARLVTADGVTVVDAKNPGWGKPILDKIKTLTDKPVTMLINTHTHGDHVSGNVEFPATIDFVAQENTKTNMEKMDIFKQNNNRGMTKR